MFKAVDFLIETAKSFAADRRATWWDHPRVIVAADPRVNVDESTNKDVLGTGREFIIFPHQSQIAGTPLGCVDVHSPIVFF